MTLRVGTRGSALATAQAGDVARQITAATGIPTELVLVTTHGDTSRESLASLGGTGVFASALREALLADRCDLVVHSMKDLPTAPYAGLAVGAVPPREDARDALCARDGLTLDELPEGARVGTGSPRRIAQLLSRRADLRVIDIRGNVDTRLGFVASGELDAVVLAAAGLSRLGRAAHITEYFELDGWLSAPAQGALAIEVRERDIGPGRAGGSGGSDSDVAAALRAMGSAEAYLTAATERGILAALEAGCAAPIGASASVADGVLHVIASVYAPDGHDHLTASVSRTLSTSLAATLDRGTRGAADFTETAVPTMIKESEEVGSELAEALLARGAATLAPLRR